MRRYAYALVILPLLTAACAAPSPPRTAIVALPPVNAVAPPPSPLDGETNRRQPILAPGAIDPDVTQQNIAATICAQHWTATIRPPTSYTNRMKLEQMPLYGYPEGTNPKSLKEDHREPLEVGGAPRDPNNLWPEPQVEAREKDRLESAVKRDVCAGRLTLQEGQAIFLGDFWREYDRRFSSR